MCAQIATCNLQLATSKNNTSPGEVIKFDFTIYVYIWHFRINSQATTKCDADTTIQLPHNTVNSLSVT